MTHKDFVLIAGVLAEAESNAMTRGERQIVSAIAWKFSEALETTSDHFDAARFLTAALPLSRAVA